VTENVIASVGRTKWKLLTLSLLHPTDLF